MSLISHIHDYIRRKSPNSFKSDWTREALEDKIAFHMDEGTISIALNDKNEVSGVLIGWRQQGSAHIPWNWQPSNSKGSHWWWDQFIADDAFTAASLVINFCEKWPEAASLPCSCHRRGKLRVYDKPGHMFKIYEKAEKLYGN